MLAFWPIPARISRFETTTTTTTTTTGEDRGVRNGASLVREGQRSERIPATRIPIVRIEPFKGGGGERTRARGWQKTKRVQQKHNFPRWRSEECSRNEWSFPSVPLALFSSSDRMFVFRKIDRNETSAPLLAREALAHAFTKSKRRTYFFPSLPPSRFFFPFSLFFFRYCYRDIFDGCSNALARGEAVLFLPYKTIGVLVFKTRRGFAQTSPARYRRAHIALRERERERERIRDRIRRR